MSKSGKYLIRTEPSDTLDDSRFYWQKTELNLFSYNEKTETFDRVGKFDVKGHPLQIFINDAGTRIVSIDQHFGVGHRQIAAIYDFKGKRLKEWHLSDLFDIKKLLLADEPNFGRSTSSIYWRGEARWSYDQKSILIAAPTRSHPFDDGTQKPRPSKLDSYKIILNPLEMKKVPFEERK